jgi:serine/threonine protein kinase
MLAGTVQYTAPEQLQGGQSDARTDIFALGAVTYGMITGRRAFEGKSQLSVATAILEKEVEPPSKAQPAAPVELDRVVGTCLAKEPQERFQCAADVARGLSWVKPVREVPPQKRTLDTRVKALVGGFVLPAVVLAVVAGYWWPVGTSAKHHWWRKSRRQKS